MIPTTKFTSIFATILLIAGCVATPVKQVEVKNAKVITNKSEVKPIAITKVVGKLRRGTEIGVYAAGWACVPHQKINWKSGGKVNLNSEELTDVFRDELEIAGWPVVGSTDDLFSGYDISGAEILVAAKIEDMSANICAPNAGFGNFNEKGEMHIVTEWQVYNPARKQLIGQVRTEGSAKIEESMPDVGWELLAQSFAVSVNNLLASQDFSEMTQRKDSASIVPSQNRTIIVKNPTYNHKTLEEAVAKAKKFTVTIRTAVGHGSGFAIGDGEYVLTNAHVVGDAENVTLVTSGGVSLKGIVQNVSKARDVALIEVNGAKLSSGRISSDRTQAAEDVFAIGSPLQEQLSGTVTQGIVSGDRMLDGLVFIQSDAAISPGNSGGPLINKQGEIVAISTAGFQSSGSQVGLNLFIPITEALKYLGIKLDS